MKNVTQITRALDLIEAVNAVCGKMAPLDVLNVVNEMAPTPPQKPVPRPMCDAEYLNMVARHLDNRARNGR